ncbi:PPA1309 family protein [Gordonia insulae]|uniref:Uncharacterized protein n=1 Tax=Gordonia insulae TaxID=2420509 RepID=A0A3G8JUJ9_9ACTN|nr:PPA1309 family protein [Gordonia insulae]AZG48593.1 hypothetical protein D7316_05210 [Gordonia insulae]
MTDEPTSAAGPEVLSADALGSALRDIVEFVDASGWDQPPMLFALVPTASLAQTQPGLVDPEDDSELSPIAQDSVALPDGEQSGVELERILATTSWPPTVAGAALVQEILVLPPEAEPDLDSALEAMLRAPEDPTAADAAARASAQAHPGGRAARLVVGALRDGRSLGLLQLRPDAADDPRVGIELLTHPDLGTDLRLALAQTLDDPDA